jgi:hypothetical protein
MHIKKKKQILINKLMCIKTPYNAHLNEQETLTDAEAFFGGMILYWRGRGGISPE